MILLTRPKEQSIESQKKLKALGFESKVFPLLEIVKIDSPEILDHGYGAIVITSQHAAMVANEINWLRDKPAYIVGAKSAKMLNGFDIKFVSKDNNDLLKFLLTNLDKKVKILFVCGDYIADNFDGKLKKHGYDITKSIVYKSQAVKYFDQGVLEGVSEILFYSPRTATVFSSLCNGDTSEISAVCISKNTADALIEKNFKAIEVAKQPNEESMFELLK